MLFQVMGSKLKNSNNRFLRRHHFRTLFDRQVALIGLPQQSCAHVSCWPISYG